MTSPRNTTRIGVTIGPDTRVYFAYVTTAPADLDLPSTVTLRTAPLSDIAGFAVDEMSFEACRATMDARLVLVDATELPSQRRRYRADAHRFVPVDSVLVGVNALQRWLWQRLGAAR